MAIDLSEDGRGFADLQEHDGHTIVCIGYGGDGVTYQMALECETCGAVLVSFDNPGLE